LPGEAVQRGPPLDGAALSNVVMVVLRPALVPVDQAAEEIQQFGPSAERLGRLREYASRFKASLEDQLAKQAATEDPRSQFYYAKGLRRLVHYYRLLKEETSVIDKESKALLQKASDRGHPGATEMLAWLTDDLPRKYELRRKAALAGCLTSFKEMTRFSVNYSEGNPHFRDAEEAYFFAFLQVLFEVHWHHGPLVFERYAPFFTDVELKEQVARRGDGSVNLSRLQACELKALEHFQDTTKRYLLGEVEVTVW
jgi:hypothetical protein